MAWSGAQFGVSLYLVTPVTGMFPHAIITARTIPHQSPLQYSHITCPQPAGINCSIEMCDRNIIVVIKFSVCRGIWWCDGVCAHTKCYRGIHESKILSILLSVWVILESFIMKRFQNTSCTWQQHFIFQVFYHFDSLNIWIR